MTQTKAVYGSEDVFKQSILAHFTADELLTIISQGHARMRESPLIREQWDVWQKLNQFLSWNNCSGKQLDSCQFDSIIPIWKDKSGKLYQEGKIDQDGIISFGQFCCDRCNMLPIDALLVKDR